MPGVILLAFKHIRECGLSKAERALSDNALLGGDCCHRGSLLGALLGAAGVRFGTGGYDYVASLRMSVPGNDSSRNGNGVDQAQLEARLRNFTALAAGARQASTDFALNLAPKAKCAPVAAAAS